jgi:DNA-binding LacI/PurR family transcriptional regulator
MESGHEAVVKMKERSFSYDGLFAGNDRMAIGAMKALKVLGVSIPTEIAVVGCDNIEMASMTEPTLTSIHQSMHEVGRIAAQKMIELLKNQNVEETRTIVSSELIIRESSD